MGLVWPAAVKPLQKLVLMALADVANDEGFCQPSTETLCRYTCLSSEELLGVLAQLQLLGLVRPVLLLGERWLQLQAAAIEALAQPQRGRVE